MVAAASSYSLAPPPDEQRMLLSNISWKEYVVLRDLFDGPGIRMTYAKGSLELMTLSPEHELWKTNIARMIELFAYVFDVDLRGYGSTTFKNAVKQRGAEPDECYLVGKKLVDAPEIVIEVIKTSPLVDKLEVYAALGVQEVWIYQAGAFSAHVRDPDSGGYVVAARSALMPELDLRMVARYAAREDTTQALREFEAEARAARA